MHSETELKPTYLYLDELFLVLVYDVSNAAALFPVVDQVAQVFVYWGVESGDVGNSPEHAADVLLREQWLPFARLLLQRFFIDLNEMQQ